MTLETTAALDRIDGLIEAFLLREKWMYERIGVDQSQMKAILSFAYRNGYLAGHMDSWQYVKTKLEGVNAP